MGKERKNTKQWSEGERKSETDRQTDIDRDRQAGRQTHLRITELGFASE